MLQQTLQLYPCFVSQCVQTPRLGPVFCWHINCFLML